MRVSIELEGPPAEVAPYLARLGVAAESTTQAGRSAEAEGDRWTPALADELVGRITTGAREALEFMMANAPETSFDELQEHLGMTGVQVGGVMASFGFAENAGFPRPYRVDRDRRRYLVDPAIAPVLLEAVERYEELRLVLLPQGSERGRVSSRSGFRSRSYGADRRVRPPIRGTPSSR
jgi:hypothetical protein